MRVHSEVARLAALLRDGGHGADRLIEHAQRAYRTHQDAGSPDAVLSLLLRRLLVELHRGEWDAGFFTRNLVGRPAPGAP